MSKIELPGEKSRGNLAPLARPRTLSAKEFNALSAEERLVMIHGARGRAKLNLLLDAVDGPHLLQLLPPQDLFLLVKELGAEDSTELLAMASAEQLAVCIDLDGWEGDCLRGEKALSWLLAALGDSEEELVQRAEEFDFDLLVLMLQRAITVVQGPETLFDDDQQRPSGVMPYELQYVDPEQAKALGIFVDCLFRRDEPFFLRLMEALRSELPTLLEEEVFQQRRSRLLEYGFPDPFEAIGVYARLRVDRFELADFARPANLPDPGPVAPGFVLVDVPGRHLLAGLLDEGIDAGSVWDLSFLLNRVLVADGVELGDAVQVQQALAEVYGYLNLALEHLCGASREKAREVFATTYLTGLFRLGYSLTLDLQQEAGRLLATTIAPYLDGPYAALLAALQGKKPRYCKAFDDVAQAGSAPFDSMRQVEATRQRLALVEAQRRLFEVHFAFDLPASPAPVGSDEIEQPTLSEFFLTALANRLLGGDFLPIPLAACELQDLHRLVAENGRVAGRLQQETLAWLESLEPGAEEFGRFCLAIWDEEFCPLEADNLDPRYIGGLLVGKK